jgi:hypothetical protein
VLKEFFGLASGDHIYRRIRDSGRRMDIVIADFLSALGVKGMVAKMSPAFGRELRTWAQNAPRKTINLSANPPQEDPTRH